MDLKYIVYLTVNLCNGKIYIGVHRTNPNVFDGYIGNGIRCKGDCTKADTAFKKAVKKYGYENFKRTTIEIFPDTEKGKEAAYKLEASIVTKTFLKSKMVYNIALGGKGSPDPDTRKVYKFSINGEFLRSYSSIKAAAQDIDGKVSTEKALRNCCSGKTQSSCGFCWSYNKKFPGKPGRKQCRICQYTLSGKFIRS